MWTGDMGRVMCVNEGARGVVTCQIPEGKAGDTFMFGLLPSLERSLHAINTTCSSLVH